MLQDFKRFLMKGNLIDLAIAVIIGLAFKEVVDTFTNGIVLPIIAAIGGKPNFNDIGFTINHAFFAVGSFLNAVLNFVIVGAVCFVVVKAYEAMQARRATGVEPTPAPEVEVVLLTEIRDLLARR